MVKQLIIILVFAFIGKVSKCQSAEVENILKNDSIKFHIILKTADVQQKSSKKGTYFIKVDINKESERFLMMQDSTFWLNKLENPSTDWAANLLLYYLYERNANTIFVMEGKREAWIKYKDRDIDYWKTFLNSKNILH